MLLLAVAAAVHVQDLAIQDVIKCRDQGGGPATAPTSMWSPSLVVTKNSVFLDAGAKYDPEPPIPATRANEVMIGQILVSKDGAKTWSEPVNATRSLMLYSPTAGKLFALVGNKSCTVKPGGCTGCTGMGSRCDHAGTCHVCTNEYLLDTSTDDGETWTRAKMVSDFKGGVGLGHGFEIANGPHKGRLVRGYRTGEAAPRDSQGRELGDFVLYSDDWGATWRSGEHMPPDTTECELTEMVNGSLLMTTRLGGSYLFNKNGKKLPPSQMKKRAFARSDDGGATWAAYWILDDTQPEVLTGTCDQPVARSYKTGMLYYGHPGAVNASRTNYTIHRSADDGATWEFVDVIYASGAGYSDMVVVPTPDPGEDMLAVAFQRTLWEAQIEGGGYNLAVATMRVPVHEAAVVV